MIERYQHGGAYGEWCGGVDDSEGSDANARRVKARLMKTATKNFPAYSTAIDPLTTQTYTSQYDLFTVGAGYLDVWAALNNTDTLVGRALAPTVRFDAATGQVILVGADSAAWGSSALWGSSAVWGSSALRGSSAVWGSSALWGSSAVWGSQSVRI